MNSYIPFFTVTAEIWETNRFICRLCGTAENTYTRLLCHVRTDHQLQLQRAYKCRLCEMAYTDLQPLVNHASNNHTQGDM